MASTLPSFTGTLFRLRGNTYELQKPLGEGAYGVVYRALMLESPPDAPEYRAIKVVRKHIPGRPDSYARLKREMELHRAVSAHPGVVTLHDAAESDEFVFMVLEYCDGGDLFDKIIEDGMFDGNDELIKKVFIKILDAVEYCHESGVFHRDLKPENILCNKDGSEVRLADFGLATNQTRSVSHGCGTEFYISPECVGKLYSYAPYHTAPADIWSLGVILINMISDCAPWSRPTLRDAGFCGFLEDPFFFYRAIPGVSRAAADLFDRIFHTNPLARLSIPEIREAVLQIDTFFKEPSSVRDETVERVGSVPSSSLLGITSNEPSLLSETFSLDDDIDEVDIGVLNASSSVPAELAMPELDESSPSTASSEDNLVTPPESEADITSAAAKESGVGVEGVDAEVLGAALASLSLREKNPMEGRKKSNLKYFERVMKANKAVL